MLSTQITNFFSMSSFLSAFGSWSCLWMILTLVLMEGILSCDNAIVLAVLVRHLPAEQHKKALTYGMIGAYAFRVVAILIGTYLIKFWQLKMLGGIYLLYLTLKHFLGDEDAEIKDGVKGFWLTILTVEAMDIVFSLDSILAALGISSNPWVLLIGGCLGILMMRLAAVLFIKLLNNFPELNHTAYVLIAMIGAKLLLSCIGSEVPDALFIPALLSVFGGTMLCSYVRQRMLVSI